jgi:hypothetical protein
VRREPGKRYVIPDHPPATELIVRATAAEATPTPALTPEQVRAALHAAGVVYGINETAIEEVRADLGPVVVAAGDPPCPPVDARVELYFPNEPVVRRDSADDEERIDPLALFQVSSVKPGELLAEKIPAREGQPGRTVTGQLIPVPQARDVQLRAGAGALLDEAGLRVYAARGGRPRVSGGIVSVLPQYVVSGNVDAGTGHVEFDGDVIVQGDVAESMRVVGLGKVSVMGVVSSAYVRGGEGVMVGHSIVRSRVVAGGFPECGQVLLAVRQLHQDLVRLVEAVRTARAGLTDSFPVQGDGALVKTLLERKFSGIPRQVEGLAQVVQSLQQEEFAELHEFVRACRQRLVGLGPLGIESVEALQDLADRGVGVLERLQEQSRSANVVVRYVQNSHVEASGRILMPQGACFYAHLFAREGVVMKSGVFRGDAITVQEGEVRLDEVGSPSGSRVQIVILTSGRFAARVVHPNVQVTIGGRGYWFERPGWWVEVELNTKGELEVRQGSRRAVAWSLPTV